MTPCFALVGDKLGSYILEYEMIKKHFMYNVVRIESDILLIHKLINRVGVCDVFIQR